ncbi:MAG: DUF11 domain-containing protein [Patescibacteria group bacterium]
MKQKYPILSSQFVDSVFTPLSLVLISIVAIIAVAVALFQVNKGPVAPNAPGSQPKAADFTGQTCALTFVVAGPSATPAPQVIDLELQKTADKSAVNVGQQITFTVSLFNRGPADATNVRVQDILPTGLQYVLDTSSGAYNSTSGVWSIASLAANQTVSLNITATVTQSGSLTNYTQVSAADQTDVDSTPGDNSGTGTVAHQDDDSAVVINSTANTSDLELTKRANTTTPSVGGSVVFTIDVVNKGPQNATGVKVADLLPTGLSYLSHSTATGNFNSTSGIWDIGNLATGSTVSLTLTAQVNTTSPVTNYSQITASSPTDSDSTPGNNSGNGTVPHEDDDDSVVLTPQSTPTNTPPAVSADLSLTKQISNSTPKVGENITYTVTVYNAGPNDATNVTVSEPLVGGTTFVSATPSQGTYNVSAGLWTIGTIPVNQSRTLQIVVTVNVSTSITNTAQVQHSDQPDPDSTPGNNNPNEDDQQSATTNPVAQGADLSLNKRVNVTRPVVGQNAIFTVEVHNAGPLQADNVTVKDLVPSGTTFIDAQPSQGSYNSGNGIWTIGSITKDSTVSIQLTLRVDTNSQIVNVAEVASSSQPDPDSTPNNNNPNEDDQDDAVLNPQTAAALPKSGNASNTTLFVIATGVIVLIIGAMGLLLLL